MKLILKSALLFVVIVATVITGFLLVNKKQSVEEQLATKSYIHQEVQHFQRQLDRALSAPYALATMLRLQILNEDNFDAIAADMFKNYGGIDNLQLAPDGVVRHIYPLAGSEGAIGHDLFEDKNREKEAFLAKGSRSMVLAGPFKLVQGGEAIVGRLPVFLEENGSEKFWGFTTTLIYLHTLQEYLHDFEVQGFQYQFSRLHPDTGERVFFLRSSDVSFEGALEHEISVPGGEWIIHVPVKQREGRGIWVLLNVIFITLCAGGVSFLYYSQARSVMQSKILETQLLHAQRLSSLGTLAGGIAHEFNNILASIKGYSELALAQTPQDSPVHRHLQVILDSSARAVVLVKQILTFSRTKENQMVATDLRVVVKDALEIARATIPVNIQINVELHRAVAQVMADADQIHQVVLNLLNNAHHAVKDGGEITVSLEQVASTVLLTIKDSGVGMSREVLEHIFDPFFTTKEVGEGTGLGLSVVHGIVKSHHANIDIGSRPGVGTTIRISFPVVRMASAKA